MPEPFSPDTIEQIGRFRVVRFIAGGGQAFVFEVEDPQNFNDRVALKLLKREAADDADLTRFEREIRTQRLIKHPNMITVYEYGHDEATGCPYYVMDMMRGGTLADVRVSLDSDPNATVVGDVVDESRVCKYVVGALSALEAIHARGLVHRDIKPQNIFLSESGIAVLGDLGIAKGISDSSLTKVGYAPGTVLYMSPEQAMAEPLDARTDLFSMGLVLYRVLTGRTVYEEVKDLDSTSTPAVQRHLWDLQREGREFSFEFPKKLSPAVQAVIRKGCAIRMEDRFESAAAMGQALKLAIRELEMGPIELGHRPLPWRWIGAAGLLVALGLGGWLARERYQDSLVEGRIEQARVLRMQAADARSVVEKDEGSEVKSLLADLDPILEEAGDDLSDAVHLLGAGSRRGAREKLTEVEQGYSAACDTLSKGRLTSKVTAAAQAVLATAATVHPIAQTQHAEKWAQLEQAKAALSPPIEAAGCAGSQLLIDRLGDTEALGTLVADLKVLLQSSLPEIAQAAIQSAAQADEASMALANEFAPYLSARQTGTEKLTQARETLARAETTRNAQDFLAAESEANEAKASFERANEASGANAARRQAESLQREVVDAGVAVGEIRQVLVAADSAFTAANWSEARAGFTDAALELTGLLRNSKQTRSLRAQADQARRDAVSAGVQGGPLADADAKYNEARSQLRGRQFGSAESGFQASIDIYRREESTVAGLQGERDNAENAIQATRQTERRASRLEAEGDEFEAAMKEGREALAAAEAHSNGAEYQQVQGEIDRSERAFARAELIAPAYRARQIALSRIEEAERQGLGETLWARDEGAAEAAYAEGAWEQSAREFRVLSETIVTQLELAAQPIASRKRAESQRRTALRKGAKDPDPPIASGDRERKRGEEELGRGNFDAAKIRFEEATRRYASYQPLAPPKPAPAPRVEPKPKLAPPVVTPKREPIPKPTALSDTPIRETLEEYRVAYEKMDVRRLRGVWLMSPAEEDDLKLMHDMCESLSVKIDDVSIEVTGDRARAEFVQTVSGSCGFIQSFPPNRYEARLRRRREGEWQITTRPTSD